jgi:hypothetical protein
MKTLKVKIFTKSNIDDLNCDIKKFLDKEQITKDDLHKIESNTNHGGGYHSDTYIIKTITISYWKE